MSNSADIFRYEELIKEHSYSQLALHMQEGIKKAFSLYQCGYATYDETEREVRNIVIMVNDALERQKARLSAEEYQEALEALCCPESWFERCPFSEDERESDKYRVWIKEREQKTNQHYNDLFQKWCGEAVPEVKIFDFG